MILRIILGKISFLSAVALTSGAVVGGVAGLCNASKLAWFCLGSLMPWWPLLWYFSSVYYLQKVIREYERLRDEKVITKQQFSLLRNTAVESHAYLRFGESKPTDLSEGNSKGEDASD